MWIYIFLLVCVTQVLAVNEGPIVNTTEGEVLGYQAADGNYYAFFDLNYAGPTSGENRFMAPVPPLPYPGIYHAMQRQIICAQPSTKLLKVIGTEDCLTLSIFTKDITTSKPVLVFIDGEDYTTTSSKTYSYKRLVEAGLVVVPMNYRLSIFGFLCLGVPEAPGNAGLKDIIHGLKWIKQNIEAFGGDPNNIVLFGHGSGAALVDLITLSPQSKSLIHKAIVQSGSALAPWAVAYDPISYAKSFGTSIGYDKKSNSELAKLLKTADINVLIDAIETYESLNNTALFAPCIESSTQNDTVLTDAPINVLKSGNYTHVPYMTGYTNKEGTLRIEKALYNNWLEKMNANFSDFLPVDLKTEANSNVSLSRTLREYYFKNLPIDKAVIEDFLDYEGDTLVLVSVIRGAKERAQTSQAEVRLYEFAYRGTMNSDWIYPQIPLTGVKHGEILNYLFDYDLSPQDEPVRSSLVTRFVSFATTGVPNNNQRNSAWMPVTSNEINYLYYSGGQGSNQSMYTETARFNPHSTRMTLWNDLYFKYYKAPTAPSTAGKLISFSLLVFMCLVFVKLF